MTKEDRDRAEARVNKAAKAAEDAKSGRTDRDIAAKAALDNMARLRALRLAREAAQPPRPTATAKKPRAKPNKSGEKSPALRESLSSPRSGGRRTSARS